MTTTCAGCGGVCDPEDWVDVEDRGPRGDRFPGEFRRAPCCGACVDRMDCDQWASRGEWESLSPAVPFDRLPEPPR